MWGREWGEKGKKTKEKNSKKIRTQSSCKVRKKNLWFWSWQNLTVWIYHSETNGWIHRLYLENKVVYDTDKWNTKMYNLGETE